MAVWIVCLVLQPIACTLFRGSPLSDPTPPTGIEPWADVDRQILAAYGRYENADLTAYVEVIGRRLGAVSNGPLTPDHFRVLDSPVPAAFSLPAGYAYITRGALALMNREAELAAVLAHIMAHAMAGHGGERMASYYGAGPGNILIPERMRFGRLSDIGLQQALLSYSCAEEIEAGALAAWLLERGGWDAIRGPLLMSRLTGSASAAWLKPWNRMHPVPQGQSSPTSPASAPELNGPTPARQRFFLQQLDGLVFGHDPRHGYIEGTRFRHPVHDYSLEYPSGWFAWIGPRMILFTSPDRSMQIQVTEENSHGRDPSDYVRRLAYDLRVEGYSPASLNVMQPVRASELVVPKAWPTGLFPLLVYVLQNRMGGPFLRVTMAHSRVYGPQLPPSFLVSPRCDRAVPNPARIRIVDLPRPCTLRETLTLHPEIRTDVRTLARINDVPLDARLPAGLSIKIICVSEEKTVRSALL